jgi:hydrogenase nickel incorporation protein HypA/HybF
MHELGIANGIVEACAERAMGAKVVRVTVEVGKLSAVMPDALRFCFDVCAQDTAVEGAALEIIETPGRALCRACGAEIALGSFFECCPCGSASVRVVASEELKLRTMEIV